MTEEPAGVVSCVVDADPRFHDEALRWYAALNRIAGVDAADLVIHAVESEESVQLDYLRTRGVSVRSVDRFDNRHPHCNKISGALALATRPINGLAVLTDTDIAFVEDPRTISVPPEGIASRIVFWPLPTMDVLTVLFKEAGLELPALVTLDWPIDATTVAGNGNGGVYLVPAPLLIRVAHAWERWARWLLDRLHLFGQVKRLGLDQVAMAMALTSEGMGWAQLDKRWNFPTSTFWRHDPHLDPPAGLHYHKAVDQSGELTLTGVPVVDGRLVELNTAIREVRREFFATRDGGG